MFDLTGRKALVTGGSRGLGKGMAAGLLRAGADIVIMSSSNTIFSAAEALEQTVEQWWIEQPEIEAAEGESDQ